MGKGMVSQKSCCEPVSFRCSDFINNCVKNYSTYMLRNNQLVHGPQGLLGPKLCSSVKIVSARLGAATWERGQGIRGPGLSGMVLTGGSVLGQQTFWPQGPSGWLPSFLWNLKQACIWTGVSEGEALWWSSFCRDVRLNWMLECGWREGSW